MITDGQSISSLLSLHSRLKDVSESPQLDCQIILANILNKSRTWLLANNDCLLNPCVIDKFRARVERRRAGEPLAYITGIKEFWSLQLHVTKDTLIPRPETELLVETALDLVCDDQRMVADLGTGSGAIAIALATERKAWSILATDVCLAALNAARENALSLGCRNIDFVSTYWCTGLKNDSFDLIVANPPYVEQDDTHLQRLVYEPKRALVAKDKGLADLRKIIRTSSRVLKRDGLLILEHGYNQQAAVCADLLAEGYRNIRPLTDYGGQPRSVIANAPE